MLFETPNFVPYTIPPPGLTHGAAMAADPRNVLESNGATIQLANGGSHSGSSGRSTPNGEPAPGKLFVGGLSWQTTNEKLQEYFSKYGNVTDVLIMKDPVTQRSRGFGFITFENPASVAGVLKCNSHSLDGKRIDPKYATPKNRPKGPNRTKKIFVGGVSQDTTVEEVKAYFSAFGKVEEAVMLMDQQTKRHRGFGFVTFENEEPVETVCEIHYHNLKGKKVECKKAMPKDAVQANAQMLGKRIILNGLGMRMAAPSAGALAANSLAVAQAQAHAQAAAAAAAAAQVQNAQRIFGAYPSLAGYRYAPYAIPTVSASAAAAAAAVPQGNPSTNPGSQLGTPLTTGPYPGYSLANVDMSSFQGVDWSPMYSNMGNMGMY